MKQDVKQKWVAALRSGEYKQGRGALHADGAFCCLGVLCDIAVKSGVDIGVGPARAIGEHANAGEQLNYDGWGNFLPPSVREWSGLEDMDPRILPIDRPEGSGHGHLDSLSGMNDAGFAFERIADKIEAEL